MNRKFLGLGVVAVVVLVLGTALVITRNRGPQTPIEEDAPELPLELRPFSTLVPTEDGHYLNLEVVDINVPGTSMVEFLLLYKTAEGSEQGTSGRAKLKDGKGKLKNQILLVGFKVIRRFDL